MTTSAPASRKRSAIPRPMPRQPPVTITALPEKSNAWGKSKPLGLRWPRNLTLHQKTSRASESVSVAISHTVDEGVAEVVVDYPPVNALPVAGWFDLANTVRGLGQEPAVHVLVLRAEGRGFNAGVDIKEMQN